MKYRVYTLGCKVNQFETQALETFFGERGIFAAEEGETADVVVVNTCAVTAESGKKSRSAIRRLKSENPGAVVAVCGCFSQLSTEEVEAIGADVVHGSGDKKRFCNDIIAALEEKQGAEFVDDPFKRRDFEELPAGAVDHRARALLKIQDGCVNFCTYCIIPYVRGRLRSLPPERCGAQAAELAAQGFSELVVTGIEIASYGVDLPEKCTLVDAIEAVARSCGDVRIRMGSLEPTVVTEEFCRRLAATGKVCDHFHLSLQSGSDAVLRAMNRKYDTAAFYEVVCRLRKWFPGCGMTADLIVGFPGETEEQHLETLGFIEKCGFSAMHIFPYSIRPGTKAAEMEGQLTHAVKARRAAEAQKIAGKTELEYLNSCVGKNLSVVFETFDDEMSVGHASNYAQVCVEGGQKHGLVGNVKITGVSGKMLVGIMV